jgi:hypothetical protein
VRQRFCVEITKTNSQGPTFQIGVCAWRETDKMVSGMLKGKRCFYPGRWWGVCEYWQLYADTHEITERILPTDEAGEGGTDEAKAGDVIGFELFAEGQLQLYRNGAAFGPQIKLPIEEEAPLYFGACLSGADMTVKLTNGKLMP